MVPVIVAVCGKLKGVGGVLNITPMGTVFYPGFCSLFARMSALINLRVWHFMQASAQVARDYLYCVNKRRIY